MSDAPDAAPGTPATHGSALRALGWGAAGLLGAVALVLAAAVWLVTQPAGTAWLVGRLPGITVTAPQGSLIGDFSAERVSIELPGAAPDQHIVIDRLRWRGLAIRRASAPNAWLRIEAERLGADRVDVRLTTEASTGAPESLQSPLEVAIGALDVAELHVSALGEQPLRDVNAGLEIGADGGRLHRIADLAFAWDRVTVRGSGQIASVAPLDTQVRIALASRPDAPATAAFTATLAASGPLAQLALEGSLRGMVAPGRGTAEPPSIDLTAKLAPFAAWPLAALELRTHALDLAALHSQAPATALSGTARLQMSAADQPAQVAIALANDRAGRVDEGRLPVRSIAADLRARPDDPTRGEIHALDIVLGSAAAAGGRVQASGQWTQGQVQLQTRLADLAPRVLDARAPAMRISGQATLDLDRGSDAPSAARAASARLSGRFSGSLPVDGPHAAVALEIDATASGQRIELRRALLHAAGSSVVLQGTAVQPAGRSEWQIDGSGSLHDFDPAVWWPGPEGSAWRKGPHRLNGTLSAAGRLPRSAGLTSWQQLALVHGRAALQLGDGSQLAGMALAGELSAQGDGRSGLDISGSSSIGGSQVALRGRIAADGADHWEIEARRAELSPWAALAGLMTAHGQAAPSQPSGTLTATVAADGRWPKLATRGGVLLENLRLPGGAKLASASARWSASTTAPQAPLEVQAEIAKLELGVQKLDRLQLRIDGTAAEHRIAIDGASPVRPPRWIDLVHGADSPPGSGTRLLLRAKGGLDLDPTWMQPLRWQGRLQQLQLARVDLASGAAQPAWFDVAESALDLQYDVRTQVPRVAVGAGRATLPNLALRWSGARWQGGAPGTQQLEVQAEVEPYTVLPLLKRLQPDFGWGGDLVVAGRVNIRSAPTFVAEIEVGRVSGDLSVTDELGQQNLELTDLRLGVDARDGVWHFTQALAGRSLGALGGALTVRTDPKAIWPPAEAPLQGVMELQIANLAAWGAWAPPGWRLQGRVHASASFGGRLGAPEYTGQINGSELGVRNLVEGVDLHDGELDIALEGETAQIRTLRALAGDGSLAVTGEARFGATPQLDLKLVADKMRLLGRVDRRVVVSGNAALGFKPGTLALDGRFAIDEGLIDISRGNAPQLGDDVTVVRGPPPEAAGDAQAPARRSVREVAMNVRVDLGRALRLRGRGLDTRLEGDLTFTAPDGRLAVNGVVRAVQGTYAAYNQRLKIERGTITFSGALDNPRLDILAARPNLDVQVGVAITGTTRQPRVSLYSSPDMSDNAKLSWLVLGRPPEESSGGDTALLQAAAMAILAGEGDSAAAQLARLNPLDTFSVHQTADGNVRNTVLTVGKQLSQRWYIGYERSLSQTSGNWQLIYRLAQRVTVRLQTGVDNSIDVIWTWRWQ